MTKGLRAAKCWLVLDQTPNAAFVSQVSSLHAITHGTKVYRPFKVCVPVIVLLLSRMLTTGRGRCLREAPMQRFEQSSDVNTVCLKVIVIIHGLGYPTLGDAADR